MDKESSAADIRLKHCEHVTPFIMYCISYCIHSLPVRSRVTHKTQLSDMKYGINHDDAIVLQRTSAGEHSRWKFITERSTICQHFKNSVIYKASRQVRAKERFHTPVW